MVPLYRLKETKPPPLLIAGFFIVPQDGKMDACIGINKREEGSHSTPLQPQDQE